MLPVVINDCKLYVKVQPLISFKNLKQITDVFIHNQFRFTAGAMILEKKNIQILGHPIVCGMLWTFIHILEYKVIMCIMKRLWT